jgi:death on curing protein
MKPPVFLTLAEVLSLHHDSLTLFGGAAGVRDMGMLESALAVPEASFAGSYLHASVYEMAAAYAFHIAENQPFVDGNKRTALASALVFLQLNRVEIKDPNGRLYDAMIQFATRQLTKQGLAKLFEELG